MKLTYKGTEERVFPALGVVKPGDVVDAPEDFAHPDFVAGGASKTPSKINAIHEKPVQPSVTDTKLGE